MQHKAEIGYNATKNVMKDSLLNIFLFKYNNENTRKMYKMYLKLTIKAPE